MIKFVRPIIEPVSGYPSLQDTYADGEDHYAFIYNVVGSKAKMTDAQEVALLLGNEHEYTKYPQFYVAKATTKFSPLNYGHYLNHYLAQLKEVNPQFTLQSNMDADIMHLFMHFAAMANHSRVGERMVDNADVALTGKVGGFQTIYSNLKPYFSDEQISEGKVAKILSDPIIVDRGNIKTNFNIAPGSFDVRRFDPKIYKYATDNSNYHVHAGILEQGGGSPLGQNYTVASYNHRLSLIVDPKQTPQRFLYEITRPLYVYNIIKIGYGLNMIKAVPSDIKELPYVAVYLKPDERVRLEDIRSKISLGAAPSQIPKTPDPRVSYLANAAHLVTLRDLKGIHNAMQKM